MPPAGFVDVAADNVHSLSIDCLRHRGLTEGAGDNRYLPANVVSRAQTATFVARLIEEYIDAVIGEVGASGCPGEFGYATE